ncbi:MAG TPA: NAD(P)H-dependent oxidoreductase [Solirubrobacteraceae bacterium]|jgi:chromate reductase|nr:NAD(P)H-dependent oxidoreductase [Solirubrobacteraceae bacterium]
MRILGICGSLRRDSHNRSLLRAAGRLLPPDAELVEWEGLRAVPPFDEDAEASPPPAVVELRAAIAEADAVLVATPEYNASLPGQLKNALDWASRPAGESVLRGKPAAVVGASTSMFGAVWAQAELRKVLSTIGARVVDGELAVAHAPEHVDRDGRLAGQQLESRLRELLAELVSAAGGRETQSEIREEVLAA